MACSEGKEDGWNSNYSSHWVRKVQIHPILPSYLSGGGILGFWSGAEEVVDREGCGPGSGELEEMEN